MSPTARSWQTWPGHGRPFSCRAWRPRKLLLEPPASWSRNPGRSTALTWPGLPHASFTCTRLYSAQPQRPSARLCMRQLRRSCSTLVEGMPKSGSPCNRCRRSSAERLPKAPGSWRCGAPQTWPGHWQVLVSWADPCWTSWAHSCGFAQRSAAHRRLAPRPERPRRRCCRVPRLRMRSAAAHSSSWRFPRLRTPRILCGLTAPRHRSMMRFSARLVDSRTATLSYIADIACCSSVTRCVWGRAVRARRGCSEACPLSPAEHLQHGLGARDTAGRSVLSRHLRLLWRQA